MYCILIFVGDVTVLMLTMTHANVKSSTVCRPIIAALYNGIMFKIEQASI